MAPKMKKVLPWVLLVLAIGLGAVLTRQSLRARAARSSDPTARVRGPNNLRVGIVGDVGTDLVVLAYERGLFEEAGMLIDLAPIATHQKAVEELEKQDLDLAVLSDVPLALMARRPEELGVIAVISETKLDMTVIAREDAGIQALADLKGKRLGIEDDVGERYALDLLLARNALTRADLTIVPLAANDVAGALRRGEVAAVAEAFAEKRSSLRPLTRPTEEQVDRLAERGLVRLHHCLVAHRGIIEKKRPLIMKTLGAILAAREALKSAPTENAKLVGRVHRVPSSKVVQRWRRGSYSVTLGPSLLRGLEAHERWAKEQKGSDAGVTDWGRMMAPELLTELSPKAVRLVR